MFRHYLSFLFCVMTSVVLAESWRPFATIPEADGASQAAYIGSLISVDGTTRPEVASRLRFWTQDGRLHLLAELEEPAMGEVPMAITERDGAVWKDDTLDLFLIPQDGRQYHFICNAIGTQFDELDGDPSWNGDWTVTAERGLYSWTCHLVVDLAQFGGMPAPGTEWGMQVGRMRVPSNRIYSWSSAGTDLFKDSSGVIRFGNFPRPLSAVPGTENANQPTFNWSDDAAPACVKTDTLDPGKGYLVHHFEFSDASGMTLFRTAWVKRASRVKAILQDCLAKLEDSEEPQEKAMVADARTLIAVNCDNTPELCSLLEEEADALRRRMEYRLYLKEMAQLGAHPEGVVYGVQNSLVRMRPVDLFSGKIGGEIALDAARNEMEAAQITLFAGKAPLLQVRARVAAPLTDEQGNAIPEEALRLRRVGRVPTCNPTYKVDYVGNYPDPLMSAEPFDVPAYGDETLWVDVTVPAGTPPGVYRTAIVLRPRNAEETIVPVTLRVRNFTIPERSSIPSAFGAWFWEDRPFKTDVWTFYEDMLQHRVTPYEIARHPRMVRKPRLNLSAGDCLSVSLESMGDGLLVAEVTDGEDRALRGTYPVKRGTNAIRLEELTENLRENGLYRACLRLENAAGAELSFVLLHEDGTSQELLAPEFHGGEPSREGVESWAEWEYLALEAPAVPPVVDWSEFDADMERALSLGITAHRASYGDPIALWSKVYREHLAEKGWLKYFYTYLADEPFPEQYPYINAILSPVKSAAGTDIKNMMTARSFPPELGFVDTWCPEIYSYNPEKAAAEQARNRNVWWYVAYGTRQPYANVWLDSPIIETRIWLWQTWKHDLDGILYWSVNWWLRQDPWRTGAVFNEISNGDGNFLYPDDSGKPIASIRWEVLRDGLEDYELFCLLEAAADELGDRNPALARRIQECLKVNPQVCVSWKEYTHDASALLAERTRLMDCLAECVDALGHEPVVRKRPRYRAGLSETEIRENLEKFRASEALRHKKNAEALQVFLESGN